MKQNIVVIMVLIGVIGIKSMEEKEYEAFHLSCPQLDTEQYAEYRSHSQPSVHGLIKNEYLEKRDAAEACFNRRKEAVFELVKKSHTQYGSFWKGVSLEYPHYPAENFTHGLEEKPYCSGYAPFTEELCKRQWDMMDNFLLKPKKEFCFWNDKLFRQKNSIFGKRQ